MVKPPVYKCPQTAQLFELLGKKWVIFVIKALDEGVDTFSAIREKVGSPSAKIISQRLDELMEGQLVERKIISEKPIQIRYLLTSKGRAVAEVIDKFADCRS